MEVMSMMTPYIVSSSPMKNHTGSMCCRSCIGSLLSPGYQNIHCSTPKKMATPAAQKMGFFQSGMDSALGNFVAPQTRPTNCSSDLDSVKRLTRTVTATQIIQD